MQFAVLRTAAIKYIPGKSPRKATSRSKTNAHRSPRQMSPLQDLGTSSRISAYPLQSCAGVRKASIGTAVRDRDRKGLTSGDTIRSDSILAYSAENTIAGI